MADKVKCPWCNEEISTEVSSYHGPYGSITLRRCPRCGKLLSGRLDGEPDDIINKIGRKEG